VVVVALGVALGDEDGLVTGSEDALGTGVTEDRTFGARLAEAVGDGRVDADGLDSEPGASVGPEAEPAVPSSLIFLLDTTSAFSSAGIHALSIDVACGA
jgi:hypothetical protein